MTETLNINSVQPSWAMALPLQMQSVLLLANRGPDGVRKHHPCKAIVRAYRASTIKAAALGRSMHAGDQGDMFMDPTLLLSPPAWEEAVNDYYRSIDELPHHYHLHLLHGAEILGYKHPDEHIASCWIGFYLRGVEDMHLWPENEEDLDSRLSDFGHSPNGVVGEFGPTKTN